MKQTKKNKKAIFRNYAPFTDCTSEINNTQVDNEKGLDVVIPMYNFIEYSDIIQKHHKIHGNI